MGLVFIDTWGWLALRDRGERDHLAVADAFSNLLARGDSIVTSDYVLDETFTLLFRRLDFRKARTSQEAILRSVDEGSIVLETVTRSRFQEATQLRLKYRDKPTISFTDFTSMVVMGECGIAQILTEDKHFEHVGLGFILIP